MAAAREPGHDVRIFPGLVANALGLALERLPSWTEPERRKFAHALALGPDPATRPPALCPAAKPGDDPHVTRPEDADVQRILSQYKRLVLLGKAKLPLAEGRRLVGPDTAFHLYFRHAGVVVPRRRRRRSAGRGRL